MKKIVLLFSLFISVSCKSDKPIKDIENLDHSKHLSQKIKNEKAIELYNKGLKLLEQRNLDSAKIYLNKSLEIEKNPIILNELGIMALSEKKHQEALRYFDSSIQQDLSYWSSHINKSRAFILTSHLYSAEKTLKNMLLTCESNYWTAYANLYLTYIYTNGTLNCKKAKEAASKAVFLKNDTILKNQYNSFINKVKENCN